MPRRPAASQARRDRSGDGLAGEEVAALWRSYRQAGDVQIRARLLALYEPYARMIAARLFRMRGKIPGSFDDYLQSALVGLLEAIERFDPGSDIPFTRYASTRIRGAILDALPKMSELHAQAARLRQMRTERFASLAPEGMVKGHLPGHTQEERLDALLELTRALAMGFLLDDSGMFAPSELQSDHRAYDEAGRRELAKVMAGLLQRLPPREAKVLRYHYFSGQSFAEVAHLMEVSTARVSQLHREGLAQLRKLYEKEGGIDCSG